GANAGGFFGLLNEARFTNGTGGHIKIDRVDSRGLLNRTGTFDNWATLTIGATAPAGLYGIANDAAATFNNRPGGQVAIDRSTLFGLLNGGAFTNEASLTIGAIAPVGSYGITNGGPFNNQGCARLVLFAPLQNYDAFTNAGLFTVSTTGVHANVSLVNNGVLVYPQGNPIPNVTNHQLVVLPLTATGLTATPALQIGSNSSLAVAATWYQDPQRTVVAGSYSPGTNAFTAGSPGTYPVYFLVTDPANGCSLPVSIPCTAAGGSLVTGPARLCMKAAPPAQTKVILPLVMRVGGNASGYTYGWSYKAPNSLGYKAIAAQGTSIGKVSFVPVANAPTLHLVGTKGNLNGLQGYLVRLTVKQGDQVVGSAQTLLDGSCPLAVPGAREGVFAGEQMQVQLYPNPVSDKLQVVLRGLGGPARVVLYDLKGQQRGHWPVAPGDGPVRLEADASALTQGVYLLQVETAYGVLHRQKVLKLR
ncbi:MAG TPA: T9SS type A sorting domain-containing protein, partial [Cytophagales bacterium]